ncbi:hypothetical protein DL98DRAFT_586000 [Cadophora sp. DSE1049]|nr:hypothetical protein DL98DRAFT_586000 [Cadophora sp. DSE1049]
MALLPMDLHIAIGRIGNLYLAVGWQVPRRVLKVSEVPGRRPRIGNTRVPSHVIGLAYGDREKKHFFLDTKLGITQRSSNPISDEADEYAPENELVWREYTPAWAIADFFELLKSQYRKLNRLPTSAHEVLDVGACFGKYLDAMIPMLQEIYRDHGWSLDGGINYRKRECQDALRKALEEQYPNFTGFR